jgi:hypothetical protein
MGQALGTGDSNSKQRRMVAVPCSHGFPIVPTRPNQAGTAQLHESERERGRVSRCSHCSRCVSPGPPGPRPSCDGCASCNSRGPLLSPQGTVHARACRVLPGQRGDFLGFFAAREGFKSPSSHSAITDFVPLSRRCPRSQLSPGTKRGGRGQKQTRGREAGRRMSGPRATRSAEAAASAGRPTAVVSPCAEGRTKRRYTAWRRDHGK